MASRLRDYARLMRLDKPVGIYLLLWPTLWALWFAAGGLPSLKILLIFVVGTVLMRSAGCVVNDLADRKFDPHVERTKDRPIAAGRVSTREAIVLFVMLCLLALALAVAAPLNAAALWLTVPAVALAVSYPFAKRFHSLPQAHLGIAFSWGIPMAFAAVNGAVDWLLAGLLLAANLAWVIAYDTLYAMVDREDDLKIGVKSSAILFGRHDRLIVGLLHALALVLLAVAGRQADLGGWYYAGLVLAAASALHQQWQVRRRDRAACFAAFVGNNRFGIAVLAGLLLATMNPAREMKFLNRHLSALLLPASVVATDASQSTVLAAEPSRTETPSQQRATFSFTSVSDQVFTPSGWPTPLSADVYAPEGAAPGGTWPAVILIHGGSWKHGTREKMKPIAVALARRGYVAVSVSYRFAPEYFFPAQLQDVQQAIRWLRQNAATYKVDPQRIAAWGNSAGAHLATLAAGLSPGDRLYAADARLAAAVGGSTPTDFREAKDFKQLESFLGEKWKKDSPLYREASPTALVSPGDPPVFLYHGTDDTTVPVSQPIAYKAALDAAGVPNELRLLKGAGHGGSKELRGEAVAGAFDFLDRYLRDAKPPKD